MSASVTDILKRNKIVFSDDLYDIQLINRAKLHRSKFQFYIERDIEQFADEIEVVGKILQPLVVRELNVGYYEILAGHRRYLSAIINAETKGLGQFNKLPCYIIDVDDVMAEYILIKTNASREKDAWEQMHEIERLKYLIPKLPANKDLKGRLQDHVASELGLTKSVVGRYEHVANKLSEKGKEWLKEGHLNITVADKLASFSVPAQEYLLDEFGNDLTLLNSVLKKGDAPEYSVIRPDIYQKTLPNKMLVVGKKDDVKGKTKSLFRKLYYGAWNAEDVKILGLSLEQLEEISEGISIDNFKDINAFRMFYENILVVNEQLAKYIEKLIPIECELTKE